MPLLKRVVRQVWAPIIRNFGNLGATLKLNDGWHIPIVGLGTYNLPPDRVTQTVKDAICAGYRHIDTAWFYKNEVAIGKGIQAKIADCTIKRNEIFVTTKLWNNFHRRNHVVPMLEESLRNLGLNYVDLYLIHWPMGFKESGPLLPGKDVSKYCDSDYLETWQGMEDCLDRGLTKSIGVSNFNSEQLERILKNCRIKPTVNQVEVTPNLAQNELISFCKGKKIVVVGYAPLGSANTAQDKSIGIADKFPKPSIHEKKVCEIAKKYHRTTAQVVLNFLISKGISVIPKTATKARLKENFDVFDLRLDESEVEYMESLNKKMRIFTVKDYEKHPHYPFSIPF